MSADQAVDGILCSLYGVHLPTHLPTHPPLLCISHIYISILTEYKACGLSSRTIPVARASGVFVLLGITPKMMIMKPSRLLNQITTSITVAKIKHKIKSQSYYFITTYSGSVRYKASDPSSSILPRWKTVDFDLMNTIR